MEIQQNMDWIIYKFKEFKEYFYFNKHNIVYTDGLSISSFRYNIRETTVLKQALKKSSVLLC